MVRNLLIAFAILIFFWICARRPGGELPRRYPTVLKRTLLPAVVLAAVLVWRAMSLGQPEQRMTVVVTLSLLLLLVWLLASAVIWSLGRRR